MKKFYACEYWSGLHTTTGTANKLTGRYSKAASLAIFKTHADRDEWVDNGKATSDMRGNCRMPLTAKEARALRYGSSVAEYKEEIEALWYNLSIEDQPYDADDYRPVNYSQDDNF